MSKQRTMEDWAKLADAADNSYLVVSDDERRQYYELLNGFFSPQVPYDHYVRWGIGPKNVGIGGLIECRGRVLITPKQAKELGIND